MKFIWNTWKYQTDGQIVPVFAHFFGTFSYFTWVPLLFKVTMYLFFVAHVTSSILMSPDVLDMQIVVQG